MVTRAIAHGELTSDGGAERVAIQLARCFDAPIYATEVDQSFVPDGIEAHELFTSKTAKLAHMTTGKPDFVYWLGKHLYRMQRSQWVPELYDYDTVIINKPALSWFVPKDGQTVIQYLHHTQRRHYDQFHSQGESVKERCWSLFHRTLHRTTIDYTDMYLCNSELTQRRAERYWGVENNIQTVYPPVETTAFSPNTAPTSDYLFAVGRLASNKRIGLLREVAAAIDTKVVVAGTGPEKSTLLEDKPPNLEYVGYISEADKARRLSEATATLFMGENEDFGIVPIESLAAGTPVLGVDEGFTQHQIRHGANGYLCEPTVEGFKRGISSLETNGVSWNPARIEAYAEQFNVARFNAVMSETVTAAESDTDIQTQIQEPEVIKHG
jgi:glycosyltransferase involved in cell wall biosynthesis